MEQASFEQAAEIVGDRHHTRRLVMTCEHASNAIPPEIEVNARDRDWLQTHWAWDLGAAALTRQIVNHKACVAILSKVSRLVCDTNRTIDAASFILRDVEGYRLSFNEGVSHDETQRRIETYYKPYHTLVDDCLAERVSRGGDVVLLSIHSFTPFYNGQHRPMELGVLFDSYEPVARRFAGHLTEEGFKVALNKPYSGRDGLIYSVYRHGTEHGVVYLELEVRQDLLATPRQVEVVAERVCRALTNLQIRGLGQTR